MRSDNRIIILQWNCRSLATNFDYLKQDLVSNDYQVLLLQSLNVKRNNLPRLKQFFYPPIYDQKEPGGKINTAIYVRTDLQYCMKQSPVPADVENISSCAVTIRFSKSIIINCASVYLPKGPVNDNTDWLKTLNDQQEKWLIGGDFNSHSPFWEKDCVHVTSNRLVENIVDSPLVLLNDGSFTRIPDVSSHRSTAIDLTMLSPKLALSCSWKTYDDTLGSDHVPILITINENANSEDTNPDIMIPKYNYKRADWSKFTNVLQNIEIANTSEKDIDTLYSTFCNSVLNVANVTIPKLNTGGTLNRGNLGNVWWTVDCERAVHEKKRTFKIYKRKNSTENHKAMKYAKIQCNRVIEQAKEKHWATFCKSEISNHKDMTKIWKQLNIIKNGIKLPDYPIHLQNNKFPTLKEKAEAFVESFSNISRLDGISLEQRLFREQREKSVSSNDPVEDNDHYLNAPLTFQETKDAISALPNKKTSVGIDAISKTNHSSQTSVCKTKMFIGNIF